MRKWTLLFMLVAAIPASATVRYVSHDGTGDFATIQAAINGSVDGDTIIVRADQGSYGETPTVDRRLVILGQGSGCGGTLPSFCNGFSFTSGGSNSVVAGFYMSGAYSINLANSTGIAVRRCRIGSGNSGYACMLVGANSSATIEESLLQPGIGGSYVVNMSGSTGTTLSFVNCIMSGADSLVSGFANITTTNTMILTNCCILNVYTMVSSSGGGAWFLDHNIFWQTNWNGNLNAGQANNSYNAITASMTSFTGTNNITITSNPFVNWTPPHDACAADVHLTGASGLINAGDPNAPNDRDGSRRDLGVYGGPLNYEISGAVDFPFVTYFTATPNVPQGGILELRSTGRIGRGQ